MLTGYGQATVGQKRPVSLAHCDQCHAYHDGHATGLRATTVHFLTRAPLTDLGRTSAQYFPPMRHLSVPNLLTQYRHIPVSAWVPFKTPPWILEYLFKDGNVNGFAAPRSKEKEVCLMFLCLLISIPVSMVETESVNSRAHLYYFCW